MTVQLNMANGIREFALASPNRVAVEDGSRSLTFAALDERSNRLANGLLSSGLVPGSRVAVLLRNRIEFFEIAVGVAKAGLVMVPLNAGSTLPENEYIINDCDARAIVVEGSLEGNVGSLTANVTLALGLDVTSCPAYESFLAESRAMDPKIGVSEHDDFCVIYTSGTTGKPKGVRLSHRARVLAGFASALEYGMGPSRRTLAVAPMYHGAGFSFAYAGPQFGGTTRVLGAWDPIEFLNAIEQSRIQTVFLVPTHAMQIRQVVEDPMSRFDLEALRTLYFNAAALPVPLKRWVHSAFPGAGIHELYGSTECFVVTNLRPEDSLRKAGSVGHAWFTNEVELRDDAGSLVEAGVPGELFARSAMLMSGYLGNAEATRSACDDRGFVTVGDVAAYDEEGFISIIDRKKDVIISGGINVYPREVEEAIVRLGDIQEAAVVGLPDETYGERIAAFLVLRNGARLDEDEARLKLAESLAKYKIPREWHVVDSLPRNAGGKILKRQVRSEHLAAAQISQD